jgi:hypothetical protein
MTKKIRRVHCVALSAIRALPSLRYASGFLTPVHINFWLKAIFDSGAATSGRRGVKGLMRSRKRTDGGRDSMLAFWRFEKVRRE